MGGVAADGLPLFAVGVEIAKLPHLPTVSVVARRSGREARARISGRARTATRSRLSSKKMFSGLMSMCTTPFLCSSLRPSKT